MTRKMAAAEKSFGFRRPAHCGAFGRMSRWMRGAASHIAVTLSAALVLTIALSPARAHEIRPTIVDTDFSDANRFTITISANLEALLAGIGPEHEDTDASPSAERYKALRALPPQALRARFQAFAPDWMARIHVAFDDARAPLALGEIVVPDDADPQLARISGVVLVGERPTDAKTLRWQYPIAFGSSILRVHRAGSDGIDAKWLKDGQMSEAIPLTGFAPRGTLEIATEYVVIGFTHILPKGLDHILFVVGLYLLSPRIRPLLTQVTAFTIAHSITLALGLYGVVAVPPSIVEPLIALSIAYVAIENLFMTNLSPWRPFVVFAFGLLHGLGFAGVLTEVGLPRADYVTGLIAFNVGVELGQLAVIAIAFALTGLWFRSRVWYRPRIVVPASIVIACIGLYWTVERVLGGA